jgi:hypothetical protein
VPKVIHANAIGGATTDKFRRCLCLNDIDKENAGNLPFPHP